MAADGSPTTRRRSLVRSALAAFAAAGAGLALAAVGDTGLAPAVGSASMMGGIVGVVTFVILEHVVQPGAVDASGPAVVSTALPPLDGVDGAATAAAIGPDPFAVGWEAADADPVTDEVELRAWDQWMSTLDEDRAVSPVWTDAPSSTTFDFKRWLPGSADHDTVQLPALATEPAAVAAPPDASELDPVLDLRSRQQPVAYPEFAPWPDAPWETAS